MARNIVQTTYPDKPARGVPGQVADQSNSNASTWICETVAGITFGRAVSKGEADRAVVIGGANFRGIAQSDTAKDGLALATAQEGGSSGADKYVQYDNMSVFDEGVIWIQPGNNVSPNKAPGFNPTTGVVGAHNEDGHTSLIAGAKFLDTVTLASGAVARLALGKRTGNDVVSV